MRAAKVALLLLLLPLSGCWLQDAAPTGIEAVFTTQIVPPLTVAVNGKASRGATTWTWDWGDGTPVLTGGPSVQVASHTYAVPGRYVIILTVEGDPEASDGSGGPGPAPGPVVGTPGVAAMYRVVDFLQINLPTPIIVIINEAAGMPSKVFYPWMRVKFYAGASMGEDIWYQWEIVRVISKENPTPIPADWSTTVEYFRSEQETFTLYLPGTGSCPAATWTYRVTLWVTDRYGRRASAETFVYVTCCP